MNKKRLLFSISTIVVAVIFVIAAAISDSGVSFAAGQSPKGVDAFQQNKRLGRGVNIHPRQPRFKETYFKMIKDAGFNNVRIPISPYRSSMDTITYTINPSFFTTLDWGVKQALAAGLLVIIDQHEYTSMAKNPLGKRAMFLSMWKQIAEHYKDYPSEVLFEVLNEPNGELTPVIWNQLLSEGLEIIRKSNPERTIIIGPGNWNQINFLDQLILPEKDRNIITTIHYYSPMEFTHQGASWSAATKDLSGVEWKATPAEQQAITESFTKAKKWADKNNRPLFLGEFGAYDKGDTASRVRWTNFISRQAEKMGWSWAYWQFDGDFIVYDIPKEHWVKPILNALIPPK
jgi:endoglucanase